MQLISLLFTHVFEGFGFVFWLTAIVGSADLQSGQNQASAVLSSSARITSHALSDHAMNSGPAIFDGELGAWRNFSDCHRPITYGHRRPCDHSEPYIDEQRFCLVGFGAGTLADMQLISLLFTQVGLHYPIRASRLLCALPAPPTLAFADAHCRKRARAPRSMSFLFAKRVFYLFLLLLLSGDVELNPGPVEMDILQSLQKGQTEILNNLASIESRIAKHEGMIADIKDSLVATKKQVEELGKIVTEHKDDISILQKEFKNLQAKNVDLENRSRRQNLLFYGVDDNKAETWDESEELIKKIVGDKLGIEVSSLQRAHRIGVYRNKKKRPIIANFASYKEGQEILSNAKKLKGSDFSIDQDFAPASREV
ncbi:hypothetical protein HPB48_005615 [Haemaphysalis longicornis]|uniref:Uncharacterized protein n=1 Tax=Haemaphysalis longicornis TaxID=44386 RepID=A0A9J6GHQ1_HAELO|nr:hypothetical protein HPB48_005615 [Haemaphysalis longicornis]